MGGMRSSQKKGLSAKLLRGVPLNQHLQLMTVSHFAPMEPCTTRYGLLSWGSPSAHCEKFDKGGVWTMRKELFAAEGRRQTKLQDMAGRELQVTYDEREINKQQAAADELQTRIDECRGQLEMTMATVRLLEDQAANEAEKAKAEGKRPSFGFRGLADNETAKKLSAKNEEAKQLREERRDKERSLGIIKREQSLIKERVAANRREIAALERTAIALEQELRLRVLDVERRMDTCLGQAVTAATTLFCFHLEQIAGDHAAMERLRVLGLLAQQETLLNTFRREKGMVDDQYGVLMALESIGFSCFEAEQGEHDWQLHTPTVTMETAAPDLSLRFDGKKPKPTANGKGGRQQAAGRPRSKTQAAARRSAITRNRKERARLQQQLDEEMALGHDGGRSALPSRIAKLDAEWHALVGDGNDDDDDGDYDDDDEEEEGDQNGNPDTPYTHVPLMPDQRAAFAARATQVEISREDKPLWLRVRTRIAGQCVGRVRRERPD